jgi:molybdate transport system substrate-binding protein
MSPGLGDSCMVSAMRQIIFVLFVLIIGSAVADAQQVTTLATMAIEGPLHALEKDFQRPGQDVKVVFDTSPNITKRLAGGEMPDVLVAQASTVDEMIKAGKAVASSRVTIGKIPVGVAMSPRAKRPDVSSVDALKQSILAADAIVYSRGASGLLVEKALRDIGVAEQIKGKVHQLPTGGDVMHRIGTATGNEIGFTMVSEIKLGESHGGRFVGPLPAAINTPTAYDAVVMSSARSPEAARAFVTAITTPSARKVLAASGWEF